MNPKIRVSPPKIKPESNKLLKYSGYKYNQVLGVEKRFKI
jgi:hypothetical protein